MAPIAPTAVFGQVGQPKGAALDFHDVFAFQLRDGGIGVMSGSSGYMDETDQREKLPVHVVGSDGELFVDMGQPRLSWVGSDGSAVHTALDDDAGAYDCLGPVEALVDLGLGRNVVNRSPGEIGAASVDLTSAPYRSAKSGRVEDLSVRDWPAGAEGSRISFDSRQGGGSVSDLIASREIEAERGARDYMRRLRTERGRQDSDPGT